MKILIESHYYPKALLPESLPVHVVYDAEDGRASVDYVGYFHAFDPKETVIILPKVFVNDAGLVFNNIPVEDLAQQSFSTLARQYHKNRYETEFVYRFSLMLYLSLREFRQRMKAKTTIVQKSALRHILSNLDDNTQTALDLVLTLIDFYKNHKDLIVFTQKNLQKQHHKKINWQKTIRTTTPSMQDETPIYVAPHQRHRFISNEDELLRIYFSVLADFKKQYGFALEIETGYELIPQISTPSVSAKVLRALKGLQGQYFTDTFRRLLKLLLLYFEQQMAASAKKGTAEFVLCSSYHLVFEDMIDKILSSSSDYDTLKTLPDGKIIDHLFEALDIFNTDRIFYIGDSKYYKDSTPFGVYAVFKQLTYAKNIIQLEINKHNNPKEVSPRYYRDDLTEGYNPTPNFFIQGFITHEDFTNTAEQFDSEKTAASVLSHHFVNRVFDRDTLIVHHFRINFLFVLRSYISQNATWLSDFRKTTIQKIRNTIRDYYKNTYAFYWITPHDSPAIFLEKHFKMLHGKLYRPSQLAHDKRFILGLWKASGTENIIILETIKPEAQIDIYTD